MKNFGEIMTECSAKIRALKLPYSVASPETDAEFQEASLAYATALIGLAVGNLFCCAGRPPSPETSAAIVQKALLAIADDVRRDVESRN